MKSFTDRLGNLRRSKFAKNVVIAATGSAGAQLITLLSAPIITRIYSPEAFGLLGSFMAILAVLGPLSSLAYPLAIVQPISNFKALDLIKVSVRIAGFTSVFVCLIIYLVGEYELITHEMSSFKYLIPIVMFTMGCQQTFQQYLLRHKRFKEISQVVVLVSMITNLLKICLGLITATGGGLILISCLSYIISVILLTSRADKIGLSREFLNNKQRQKYTREELTLSLREYKDFPLYRAPQIAINAFSQVLPVLLLGSLSSLSAAGFYTLSRSVLGIPSTLIGKAIGDVFYPRITEAKHQNEDMPRLIIRATLILAGIGILPFSFVLFTGPWLFSTLFGENWDIAGRYGQWLSIWLFFGFVNRPCVAAIPVIKEQAWLFVYEIFSTGFKVLSLGVGFYVFEDDVVAVALFSLSGSIAYIYLISAVIRKTRNYNDR